MCIYKMTKWCYNVRMKDAVAKDAALVDWNDAPFMFYVKDQWNLIKERILRCLFVTVCTRKSSNRTTWLKSRHEQVQQIKHLANTRRIIISLPSMCTNPRISLSHASWGRHGGSKNLWQNPSRKRSLPTLEEIVNSAAKISLWRHNRMQNAFW